MTVRSTLFLILLSSILVFGHLHPTYQNNRRQREGEPIEGRKARTWSPDRQQRSFGSQSNPKRMLKVLDFSADIDRNPESNGEYTSANLEAGPLPKSFTICSAFMVEAWTTDYAGALMFVLFDVNGNMWGYVSPPQPSFRPAHSPHLLQQQHRNTSSSLYFSERSAHKSKIRIDLVHKRERNLTKEVRGSKGQGGNAGRGVGSLTSQPTERCR